MDFKDNERFTRDLAHGFLGGAVDFDKALQVERTLWFSGELYTVPPRPFIAGEGQTDHAWIRLREALQRSPENRITYKAKLCSDETSYHGLELVAH